MKAIDTVCTGMEELKIEGSNKVEIDTAVQERLLKRQLELNKEFEKRRENATGYDQIETFLEAFSSKQSDIEIKLKSVSEKGDVVDSLNNINSEIQDLQNFYSNSTIFLRIYDKKTCQAALHGLHNELKDVENKLIPKKKFGFRVKKAKTENGSLNSNQNGQDCVDNKLQREKLLEFCGFQNHSNEQLILTNKQVQSKDVLINNINNCVVKILGTPSTLHMTNIKSSQIFCGPVSTSVMIEKCENSNLYLACQQLRIHETINTDIHLHVTSKAIIEDSKNVRFGTYNYSYEDMDKHYKIANLDRSLNNWDKVDDFNWLAIDKPSPNWSLMENNQDIIDDS